MLFERSPVYRHLGRAVLSLGMVAALASCQVRPLYSSDSAVPARIAAMKIDPVRDRIGQEVRNRLIFLTTGGAGEPAKADYSLALNVSSTRAAILNDEIATKAPLPSRVTVTATYVLTRLNDGQIIRAGKRSSTSLLDLSRQEFAKLRAYRDAENRAADEVAEFVRADIASALAR